MSMNVPRIDRAIAERYTRSGRFTVAELRADLSLGPDSPEAKNLANRIHRLHRKMGVLKNDGINARNKTYVFVNDKKFAAFKRGVVGSTPAGTSEPSAPARVTHHVADGQGLLGRLAEVDNLKLTITEMTGRIDRIEKLLFGETPGALQQPSSE